MLLHVESSNPQRLEHTLGSEPQGRSYFSAMISDKMIMLSSCVLSLLPLCNFRLMQLTAAALKASVNKAQALE